MKTIDSEKLISTFVSQCRSADLWVGLWDKNKDIGAAKNALTALGKVSGVYNVLLVTYGDENLPEPVIELNLKYGQKWDEIMSHCFYQPK